MNLKENLRRKLTLNSYELLLFNLIMEFYCENVMIIIFMSIFIGFRNQMEAKYNQWNKIWQRRKTEKKGNRQWIQQKLNHVRIENVGENNNERKNCDQSYSKFTNGVLIRWQIHWMPTSSLVRDVEQVYIKNTHICKLKWTTKNGNCEILSKPTVCYDDLSPRSMIYRTSKFRIIIFRFYY